MKNLTVVFCFVKCTFVLWLRLRKGRMLVKHMVSRAGFLGLGPGSTSYQLYNLDSKSNLLTRYVI